jgi:hypothetical protein
VTNGQIVVTVEGLANHNGSINGFQLVSLSNAFTTYCTAKTTSIGCVPSIGASGVPSASAGSGFTITASDVINNKNGLLFYSLTGQQAIPFQGGTLCGKPPIRRTTVQNAGGNPPPNDCSGTFAMDFNVLIASGVNPLLVAGQQVDAQWWFRDPGFSAPNNSGLSNAIDFVIQ